MITLPNEVAGFLDAPVAVLGNGVTGHGVIKLLQMAKIAYVVYDQNKEAGQVFDASCAREHGLVVYSPGFAQNHEWLRIANLEGCECLAEMDFAALFWKGKILTVTGTDGKTTLATFLAFALKKKGLNAVPAGNNGDPLSGYCELFDDANAIAVCEVSSFQSEKLKYFTPQYLLWTNFDEDHLDRYSSMREYFEAKWNLVDRTREGCIFVGSGVYDWMLEYHKQTPANMEVVDLTRKVRFPGPNVFEKEPQSENFALALAVWKAMGYEEAELIAISQEFELPKHRLQVIAEFDGLRFWNDSKATTFHAARAALNGFADKVLWIGGGKSKGGNLERFIFDVSPKIAKAYLIGEEASRVKFYLEKNGVEAIIFLTLDEAVEVAAFDGLQNRGNVTDLVFSPAFTSYDMFKNYIHRGNYFENCVFRLKLDSKGTINK